MSNRTSAMQYLKNSRWLLLALALHPAPLWACAACYGQSDSPLAKGMNWGILSLLVVIVTVLGGIAGFAVYMARRAASFSAQSSATNYSTHG